MSEQVPESPASVVVDVAAPVTSPAIEETALAAGAALSLSGEARAEAGEAVLRAETADANAENARAEAAAAGSMAVDSAAKADTVEERLGKLVEMMTPLYDDYAARKAAESAKPEVTEVDATGTDAGTTGGTTGTTAVSDSGSDDNGPSIPRRGLRRGRR